MLGINYSEKRFIDRPVYTNKFTSFLNKNIKETNSKWIYFQYDAAEKPEEKGGIGKTMLIQEYVDIIKKDFQQSYVCVEPVIDFIEINNRTTLSMFNHLINYLQKIDKIDITTFRKFVNAYFENNNVVLLKSAIDAFYDECNKLYQKTNRKLVFFFDTFEIVQDEIENLERAILFPADKIQNSAVIIISSRNMPDLTSENWKERSKQIEIVSISGFDDEEAKTFFRQSGVELNGKKIKINEKFVEMFNNKDRANGRPILLALAIDYIKNNVLDAEELLKIKENFREEFVNHLNKFNTPIDMVIKLMAHVYHPWDITVIKYFEKFWKSSVTKIITTPKEIFDKLSALSFVRMVGKDALVLHDEMRDLVILHVWKVMDNSFKFREEISYYASQFYKELYNLKQNQLDNLEKSSADFLTKSFEYKSLLAEYWYHLLFCDIEKYYQEFLINKFNPLLDFGDIEQADLFMKALEELNSIRKLPKPEWNRILLRKMRIYLGRYYLDEAKKLGDSLIKELEADREGIKQGEVREVLDFAGIVKSTPGKISKSIGNFQHYLGEAFFLSGDNSTADNYFQKADNCYKISLEEESDNFHTAFLIGRNINWRGYIRMKQGDFIASQRYYEEAEEKLQNSLTSLENQRKEVEKDEIKRYFLESTRNEILQWIGQINGNRCIALRNLGKLTQAEECGFTALQMRRKLKLTIEIVKSLNSLGLVYQKQFHFAKAWDRYQKALTILKSISDLLLEGRIYTNIGSTFMRREAFSEIFYFSNKNTLDDSIKDINGIYKPDLDEALKYFEISEKLLHAIGHPTFELTNVLFNIGEFYMYKKEWENAINYFEQALNNSLKIENYYMYYDIIQRLLSVHYFSDSSTEFVRTMNKIDENGDKLNFKPLNQFPNLEMRVLLIKGNWLIDAFHHNDKSIELLGISKDESVKKGYEYFYNAAKIIFPVSRTLYNKIVELMFEYQKNNISTEKYNLIVPMLEGLSNADRDNKEFFENFRLYI